MQDDVSQTTDDCMWCRYGDSPFGPICPIHNTNPLYEACVTATPGPWEVAYLDHNGQRVVKGEHIEIATCWHHSVGSIEKEMEANAMLIAAAPDMLAALKAAEGHLEEMRQDRKWHPIEHCPVLDQVRRAIAAAEGNSQ